MLEYVNRARQNPTNEGVLLNAVNTWYSQSARSRQPSFFTNLVGEFAGYPAVPPLTFHPKLLQAARAHSREMADSNYLAHVNLAGLDPTARAKAAGYDMGVGENIDGGGAANADDVWRSHFGLMVDYDNMAQATAPLGHRLNVLRVGYTEIGIGIAGPRTGGRITQDFGPAARAYILGVMYADTNADGAYSPGEGVAGVTVTPDFGDCCAVTSSSGGFAIPVSAVETVSNIVVNVPVPVATTPWASVEPYDLSYRKQQLQSAPTMTVKLTWSGGSLPTSRTTQVTIKRPVLRNYHLTGTDGYFYDQSVLTMESVKADLVGDPQGGFSGWRSDATYGWLWDAGNGWYANSTFGWLWFSGNWVYSSNLKNWLGQVGSSRTLWSPQFRWLTPSESDPYRADTTAIGAIYLGQYNGAAITEGWAVSDRFGYVWAAGDGKWFYSNTYGWLGVTDAGGIWCVNQGRFL